jgi:hypothetical protein
MTTVCRKRDGGHQGEDVGALLGGFARPRERHGDDRRSTNAGDALDETTGGRYEFAHANAPPEPPSAGKNGQP